jgi:hypothetical protein
MTCACPSCQYCPSADLDAHESVIVDDAVQHRRHARRLPACLPAGLSGLEGREMLTFFGGTIAIASFAGMEM